jgi:hypothetical protein
MGARVMQASQITITQVDYIVEAIKPLGRGRWELPLGRLAVPAAVDSVVGEESWELMEKKYDDLPNEDGDGK